MDLNKQQVFVMGDLHGAHKALLQCLNRSGFDYEKDLLIQLGDVADGYSEVFECVEELLTIKNLIAIKGNHDDWFNEFINTGFHPVSWNHGGNSTISSYLKNTGNCSLILSSSRDYKTSLTPADIPSTHREFFEKQRPYYILNNRCFLHAGFDRFLPFEEQNETEFYWNRDLWWDALDFHNQDADWNNFELSTDFDEIYIGHTPTLEQGTVKPITIHHITNVDTGVRHGGRLTIMNISTKQYWQSDPADTLYSNPDHD